MKDFQRKFALRKNICKMLEVIIRTNFSSYVKEFKESSEILASVGYLKFLKKTLLEATYRNCGWTKEPEKQIKTC